LAVGTILHAIIWINESLLQKSNVVKAYVWLNLDSTNHCSMVFIFMGKKLKTQSDLSVGINTKLSLIWHNDNEE